MIRCWLSSVTHRIRNGGRSPILYDSVSRIPYRSSTNNSIATNWSNDIRILTVVYPTNSSSLISSKKLFSSSSLASEPSNNKDDDDDDETKSQTCSTFGTFQKFDDFPNLHPSSKRAISQIFNFTHLTEIQSKTFQAYSSGHDILGRARTGTGKTLAFLLPLIETILQQHDETNNTVISALIISPTRELATQIHQQTETLLTYHPNLTAQVVYGGTSRTRDIKQLQKNLPSVLIATPGRLYDHIQNTTIRQRPFSEILQSVRVLVLDETDRLLDEGFRQEVTQLLSHLPPKKSRQTLLFSATLPQSLRPILEQTLNPKFEFVDCIMDDDDAQKAAQQVNSQVIQSHVILPDMKQYIPSLLRTIVSIQSQTSSNATKIITFFPTTKLVSYFSHLFSSSLQIPVIEIHSRKTQSERSRASAQFKSLKQGILFTSDVSARGMDYPDVTHVIQFGLPLSREAYIHRLGRTGRVGKKGRGYLMLLPFEQTFLEELKGLHIPEDEGLKRQMDGVEEDRLRLGEVINGVRIKVREGKDETLQKHAEDAYRSMVLYYNAQFKRLGWKSKEKLIRYANEFAFQAGLKAPPALKLKVAKSLGLIGIRGLNVDLEDYQRRQRVGGMMRVVRRK